MIALGIDPGTRRLGWGVVRRDANRVRHVAHGVIVLDARAALGDRLCRIDEQLGEIVRRYAPTVGSVESLFFHKDATAASKLGHARGVALLVLARSSVAVAEYPPAKVKRTIAGNGQADKRQVAIMVRGMLALDATPPPDAADALALALTHLRLGPAGVRLVERPRRRGAALLPPDLERLVAAARRRRASRT